MGVTHYKKGHSFGMNTTITDDNMIGSDKNVMFFLSRRHTFEINQLLQKIGLIVVVC